jgi:hypothetical protein
MVYAGSGITVHGHGPSSLVDRYADVLIPTTVDPEDALDKPVHVHRLDAPVGGLLIVVKTKTAQKKLRCVRRLHASLCVQHIVAHMLLILKAPVPHMFWHDVLAWTQPRFCRAHSAEALSSDPSGQARRRRKVGWMNYERYC